VGRLHHDSATLLANIVDRVLEISLVGPSDVSKSATELLGVLERREHPIEVTKLESGGGMAGFYNEIIDSSGPIDLSTLRAMDDNRCISVSDMEVTFRVAHFWSLAQLDVGFGDKKQAKALGLFWMMPTRR
jgi:hypothetical protein